MKFDIRNAELYYGDFKALKGIPLFVLWYISGLPLGL